MLHTNNDFCLSHALLNPNVVTYRPQIVCRTLVVDRIYNPPKNFGVAPPMNCIHLATSVCIQCNYRTSNCASATENIRCWRHSVFECVRPWVGLWDYASQKPLNTIWKNNEENFAQFWLQMYVGSQMRQLDFGVKRSKVKCNGSRLTSAVSHRIFA